MTLAIMDDISKTTPYRGRNVVRYGLSSRIKLRQWCNRRNHLGSLNFFIIIQHWSSIISGHVQNQLEAITFNLFSLNAFQ